MIRWTFVAAVYDQRSGNATLFVDGTAVTSQTSIPQGGMASWTGRTDQNTPPLEYNSAGNLGTSLRVGAGYSATAAADGSTGFIGIIDEAFVYGTALTVDELDYLYHAAQVITHLLRLRRKWFSRTYILDAILVSMITLSSCSVHSFVYFSLLTLADDPK